MKSTEKAKRFMKANDESPVVAGAAIGNGGEGGYYHLANGQLFKLSVKDCMSLAATYPIWIHDKGDPHD